MMNPVKSSKWPVASGQSSVVFLLVCVLITTIVYSQTPQQNAARLRLAQDLERLGQYDKAADSYAALFHAEVHNEIYYQGLRRVLLQLRRYDDLISIINRRLEMIDDINTRVDLGDVYFKRGDPARAHAGWKEVLQRHPHPGTFSAIARAMVDNHAYDEALQIYLQARQQLRDPGLFVLDLANLYSLRLNYAAAAAEYLRHLESNPRQFPFVQSKVNEMAREDSTALESMVTVLEQAIAKSIQPQAIHRLLAGLFMQSRQYARALQAYKTLEMLTSAQDKANIGSEIFTFAEQARGAAAHAFAEQAYLMIVKDMPDSPYWFPAQFGLGQALQAQGKYAEAQAAYATMVEESSGSGRNPWALRGLLAQGEVFFEHLRDMPRAIAIYKKIYESPTQPGGNERVEAIFRLGDCYLALGDIPQAATWYEKARPFSRTPNSPPNQGMPGLIADKVNHRLARLAYFQGRFREVQKLLEAIVASQPPAGAASERQPAERETESVVNDALELLLLLDTNLADSAGALLSYAQAEYAAARQNQPAAIDTLETLLRRFPQSPIAPQALFNLGDLYADRQEFDTAIIKMRRILEQYPESVVGDRSLFRLAEIYETGVRDSRKAQELYEQLLRDYPQSLYLEEARRRARNLAGKNKSS
jgi:tetratricopeptide (TPR) repeat protein